MVYSPNTFHIGLWVSGISIALLILIIVFEKKLKKLPVLRTLVWVPHEDPIQESDAPVLQEATALADVSNEQTDLTLTEALAEEQELCAKADEEPTEEATTEEVQTAVEPKEEKDSTDSTNT